VTLRTEAGWQRDQGTAASVRQMAHKAEFPERWARMAAGSNFPGNRTPFTQRLYTEHLHKDTMRSLFLGVFFACSICAHAQSTNATTPTTPAKKASPMTHIATGEFAVKLLPLGAEGQPDDPKYGRMSINKSITGGLVATTVGQMLTAGTAEKGSAAYVAVEKVDGVLDGRKGSFALMHTGVMNRGTPSLTVTVVPDSGTDELTGIAGEFKIIMGGGKHAYEFKYTLP
jgi:hypothetical protein